MSQQNEVQNPGKREFLKVVLGGSLAAFTGSVLYPLLMYLKPPKYEGLEVSTVKAGRVDEFERDSGKIIKFGTKPVLLIRTQEDEFRAFSAICTHLDCTVQYRKDKGVIWCACHNGTYDLTGRNIAGPPPRPLDKFRVIVQGEDVVISKNV